MTSDKNNKIVATFIDASNLHHAQKANGWSIDYKKLSIYLDSFGQKCGRYYFTPTPPSHDTKAMCGYKKFKKALIFMGYTVIDKELKEIKAKDTSGNIIIKKKADLDMEMGQWMDKVSKFYNIAIIMGGDCDFVTVIQQMVLDGKYIIVISNKNNTAIEVQNIAHEFIDLKTLKTQIER
jgi:uncharacterized LabA/DUF88 family protein